MRLPHDDPLVIKLQIDQSILGRVLVDGGSSADVLFWDAYQKVGMDVSRINPSISPLVAFDNSRVIPKGVIQLMVYTAERILPVNFLVVECKSAFNAIMGRGWIHAMQGVVSTLHQVMRCQSPDGTYTIDIKSDQSQARRCHFVHQSEGASTSGTKKEQQDAEL